MPAEYVEGIVIGVSPIAFQIGPASIRWYGIAIAVGLAVGLWLTLREGARRGLASDTIYSAAVWAVLAGIVGGRLFHLVDKLDFYLQNPYQMLSLSQGAMAIWGSVLGGLLGLYVYARRTRLSVGRLADSAVPGLIVGQMIGRLGSLINGESWGSPTSLPWGITYVSPDAKLPAANVGIPTHPYPVYEILWLLVVLAIVRPLRRRIPDGALTCVYLLLYSVGRFGLTVFRQEGVALFGLQQAQVVAAAVFLVALPWLVYILAGRPEQQRVTARQVSE